jgi:hypothetical protein
MSWASAMAQIPGGSPETEVLVQVKGENGEPIVDAEVLVWYSNPQRNASGERVSGIERSGLTDEEGVFISKENGRAGITVKVKKDGYYPHGYDPAAKDYFGASRMPESLEKEVVLRKIIAPVPLFGMRVSHKKIPEEGNWIGFDLEFGDWVKPHGDGERPDMLLRYTKRFLGMKEAYLEDLDRARKGIQRKYERRGEVFSEDALRHEIGRWEGILEVSFPKEKEGIISVIDAFMPNSLLKMPHLAVNEGYHPSYSIESSNFATSEKKHFSKANEDKGFFVRTRVVLDRQGNIESANYAKIYGDIAFDPRGVVSFSYYFNPVVNDRNLEFDPKQNLFPEGASGTFNFVLP